MAKARVNYIDALRGFTMLLVVFAHVLTFGFHMERSFISQLFITFRMPMFFFISGFIAYKSVDKWDGRLYRKMLKKKTVVQIIPATVFWLLFVLFICKTVSPIEYIQSKGFAGYWFTYTLLVYFVVYYTVSVCARRMPEQVRDKFLEWTLVLLAVLGVVALGVLSRSSHRHFFHIFSILNVCNYFQFFVFGLLCKKHQVAFERTLCDNRVLSLCMMSFVACLYLLFQPRIAPRMPLVLSMICSYEVVRYAGVVIVFAFFFHHAEFFNQGNRLVRCMVFVGRRTLDIYLLHFFLMPFGITMPDYAWSHVFVVQLFVALMLSVLVVAVCLALSRIIRINGFMGHYLLGAKRSDNMGEPAKNNV